MWVLRVGRKARWEGPRDASDPVQVAEAAEDLRLGPDEVGLSVYRVDDPAEVQEVAVRFALTCRRKPEHLDYVLFPEELATELGLDLTPMRIDGLHPDLNDRHYEILGLTDELRLRLAAAILGSVDRKVGRIRDKALIDLGREACRRDPALREFLKGDWPSRLPPSPDATSEG
jgi:hypothetical protein